MTAANYLADDRDRRCTSRAASPRSSPPSTRWRDYAEPGARHEHGRHGRDLRLPDAAARSGPGEVRADLRLRVQRRERAEAATVAPASPTARRTRPSFSTSSACPAGVAGALHARAAAPRGERCSTTGRASPRSGVPSAPGARGRGRGSRRPARRCCRWSRRSLGQRPTSPPSTTARSGRSAATRPVGARQPRTVSFSPNPQLSSRSAASAPAACPLSGLPRTTPMRVVPFRTASKSRQCFAASV